MRLSRIKLSGFKSFVDPVTIQLPSNLLGIVGPNGCGKSNVIDAVRWVMGESSAKQLRGDSMADVIFNGSSARKPVGHATIELVFDNSDGAVGGQYATYNEISIKRQVSRDGQSNYFLNGARCRRRDITDIFLGTGLGPRSYAIIEQGMISRLIEARPEELRIFLEEAAGISKYKERRKETEARIGHARENLSRLNDVRDEVEKHLQNLQRQAKAAERYKELKYEERQVKAELLGLRWRGLDVALAVRDRELGERMTRLEAAVAEQRAVEGAMEKSRAEHAGQQDVFNAVQARYFGVGADISRTEQAIQHARDTRARGQEDLAQAERALGELQQHLESDAGRLDEIARELQAGDPARAAAREEEERAGAALVAAEEAMQCWQAEWEAFNRRSAEPVRVSEVERARIDHLERSLLQIAQRRDRAHEELRMQAAHDLDRELGVLSAEQGDLEQTLAAKQRDLEVLLQRIAELRERSQSASGALAEAQGRLQSAQGRLASLEALQQAALGQSDSAVAAWLEALGLQEAPRLAHGLQASAGWERAVEIVLGTQLQAVCVENIEPLAGLLGRFEGGSVTLFDTTAAPGERSVGTPAALLVEKVQSAAPLGDLLRDVYAVEDLATALALRAQLAPGGSVITRDGIWVSPSWLRVSRGLDERSGILERQNEINLLSEELNTLQKNVQDLEVAQGLAREELQSLEWTRETTQVTINEEHRRHAELRSQVSARRARMEQMQKRAAALQADLEELTGHTERDNVELQAAHGRLQAALDAMEAVAQERDALAARREQLRVALEEGRTAAHAARQAYHEIDLRVQSMRTAREAVESGMQRMRDQRAVLSARCESLRRELVDAAEPLAGA